MESNHTREQVVSVISAALASAPFVRAAWLGGSSAFGRVDEWSDIDLNVIVEDDSVAATFELVEDALARIGGIDLVHEVPQPAWHGHAQKFYRLREASPFLLVDFVVQRRSAGNRFLEREVHGEPEILFDRDGLSAAGEVDADQLERRLRERRGSLPVLFDLFQVFVQKELNRGNDIEALTFYHAFTLRPLVEAARIRYTPWRASFHTRHIHYDLPDEIVARLRPLFFVVDAGDLQKKMADAKALFAELV